MNLASQIKAAAWRENLGGYRDRPKPDGAREGAFDQLDVDGPDEDPVKTLEEILGSAVPEHLAAELHAAHDGLADARTRAARRNRHFAALAARAGAGTLAELIAACSHDAHTATRLLETLATEGHQLHPCARTRLGWDRHDRERYDLEATRPVRVRLIADRAGILERSGDDFRDHPMLHGLDLPDPVLPVHPWQLEHRILPGYRELFDSGKLRVMDETVPAWPTAAIRTLAGHDHPGFLKLALGIHITSTRRDISPATALLGPRLSGLLGFLHRVDEDEQASRHRIIHDTAGAWLPGSRELTALGRMPLPASTGTVCVPATALTATSPVTGMSLAAEYAQWSGDPEAWIRRYALLFARPVLHLAAKGIGLEAHLQNSLVAMRGPDPVYPITRDFGGARIHLPTLPWRLELPEGSPVNAHGIDQVRSKVAYTLFQNHFAALVAVLERDLGLDGAAFWADLADHVAALTSPADRDYYLAPRQPTKALLTMRLHPGEEIETLVDNPLAKPRKPILDHPALDEAVKALPSPSSAWIYDPAAFTARLAGLREALAGHTVLYAMKACANPAILAAAAQHADGIECASLGELTAARAAGAARLAFSGPAKSTADFAAAAAIDLPLTVHAESARELRGLADAGYAGPVALRVNRGRALPGTHQMTGAPTPFGIDEDQVFPAVNLAQRLGLQVTGFHLHAVSNCLDAAAYAAHVRESIAWAHTAARSRFDLRYVNVGGGLGADPRGDAIDLRALAEGLRGIDTGGAELVFEPGRYLAAPAGWYVAEVVDVKTVRGQVFALVRGGTHHFRLPAAWGYSHPFTVAPGPRREKVWADVDVRVCGELCTPRDVLNGGQRVAALAVGDRLVFANAGAYGWEISHDRFLGHAGPEQVVIG
ncbi:IucA/IucC family protein [Glycomyces rhizosphaerae]|uniref:IucA/IucC family protein n=1 Tax=Glycomyces rhizosphaerae TaxID=2054422 RepID=A0ABV7PZR9_9ACTN